jgi:hypothetical protein
LTAGKRVTAALAASLLIGVAYMPHWRIEAGAPQPVFREAATETGLVFQHFTGATGDYFLPEIMGAGVALFDYDGDGDLDVYLIQGDLLDKRRSMKDALFPAPKDHWPGNRLFRNELIPSGHLRFTDVTEQAGVGYVGYGMGVAVGDIDNDGRPDLFVTNFGPNVLYRNNGDGTFTDITRQAGLDGMRWSTSAAFLDYDRDGNLDLVVTNYVDFSVKGNIACYAPTGERDYCNPAVYRPIPARLYRNDGKGHFLDVTRQSGVGAAFGNGLGVSCADFNGDGWLDIFVANDGMANQLWINQRNGTFKDMALSSGVAYNADGAAQAGMGVATGDFDNDGDEDIFVTHLARESNTLYVNDGKGVFHDGTIEAGLSRGSFSGTGFGTEWFDYDNDGFLDLFIANGAVSMVESLRGRPYPYQQRNQLFHSERSRKFSDVTSTAGPVFQLSEVSRGAAFGDIDNDGRVDVVVTNNNGPVRLLLNQAGSGGHWLTVRLVDRTANVSGALVGLTQHNGATVWRRAHTDGSYLSSSDPRVHFGLGSDASGPARIEVRWPSGKRESWNRIKRDSEITLRAGTGQSGALGSDTIK